MMSDFLAAYGLWLLIAILVVIVVMFLLVGGKRTSAEPISTQTAPEPTSEATTPVPATPETPVAVEEPIAAPVAVAGGAVPLMVTPEPALDTPAPEPETAPETPTPEAAQPAPPPTPAAAPAPAPAPAEASVPDDLLLLKGVGPKLKALLAEQGITRFAQIAAWTSADLAAIDPKLGTFKGRPERDNWIDQAQYLAKGDIAGFEAKYGKL